MASIDAPTPIISSSVNNAQLSDKQPQAASEAADDEDAVRKVEEATTPSKDAQQGVRSVEAVTLTWTKTSLVLAFIW